VKRTALSRLIRFLRRTGAIEGLDLDGEERGRLADWLESLPAEPATERGAGKSPGPSRAAARESLAKALPAAGKPSPEAWALLQCDGASRGNPGPAALGFVISSDGQELFSRGEVLGQLTNNQAEYRALMAGLDAVRQLGFHRVDIAMDSELVVRQLEGRYKVKNEGLKPLHAELMATLARFADWKIRHVPRGQNAAADALANEALDSR